MVSFTMPEKQKAASEAAAMVGKKTCSVIIYLFGLLTDMICR